MRIGIGRDVRVFPIQLILLVMALLTINAVCVARCIGIPCDRETQAQSEVPPCHGGETKPPVDPCKQLVLLAAADQVVLAKYNIAASVFTVDIPEGLSALSFPNPTEQLASLGAAPPGTLQLRFSVVFRL